EEGTGVGEGGGLPLVGAVVDERVVHVVADGLDRAEVEGAVREHAAGEIVGCGAVGQGSVGRGSVGGGSMRHCLQRTGCGARRRAPVAWNEEVSTWRSHSK